jgi:Fur family ferric uptake transcriptional regulator
MKSGLLDLLKENKVKITDERRGILSILEKAELPLSPLEIFSKLKKDYPKANLTTIYRNLEMLENLNLVKRLSHDKSYFSYELVFDRPHHHHLVCQNCGQVEDLDEFGEKFVEEVSSKTSFRVQGHNIEFYGLCPDCQKTSVI